MTPIVLLHAFPFDSRMSQQQVDVLSGKFTVIVPGLRGFGTAYPELGGSQEIPIDLAADDVVRLLDEKGFAKAELTDSHAAATSPCHWRGAPPAGWSLAPMRDQLCPMLCSRVAALGIKRKRV